MSGGRTVLRDGGLPHVSTLFVGREPEIATVRLLLGESSTDGSAGTDTSAAVPIAEANARVVTLCGIGGSGKTRLALEIARRSADPDSDAQQRFPDGVQWVSLAPRTHPAQLPAVVAAAVGLRDVAHPQEAFVSKFRDRRVLLVLDNCEHLIDACRGLVATLVPACAGLAVLSTSRIPLGTDAETVFVVPPLRTRPSGAGSAADGSVSEATRLFLDRVATVIPAYDPTATTTATIGRICQRLEGLPLAIELAATWMRVLTAADLLAEIERSISFLSSSDQRFAARHRSLQAVLESSWQRLADADQQVLLGLAVFLGSFSREAAEAVAGASLTSLSALTERSLVQRVLDSETETRYHLHELVRQYVVDRPEASDGDRGEQARGRHLDYFVSLVEHAAEVADTSAEPEWLDRLRTDEANLDAALHWALDHGRTEHALRMSAGLFPLWVYSSPVRSYRATLEQALAMPWDASSPSVVRARAKASNVAGYAAATATSGFDRAHARFDEGLLLYDRLGDDCSRAWTLRGRSFVYRLSGDDERARAVEEVSLEICRTIGDRQGEAWSVYDLGEIAFASGDLDRADQLVTEGLRRFEEQGLSFGAYRAAIVLGDLHRRRGRWLGGPPPRRREDLA